MSEVIVVTGAGSIGPSIARRVSAGNKVVLADLRRENADAAAKTMSDAGFDVIATTVDIASRASIENLVETSTGLGNVTGLIHAAGLSPSQAPIEAIFKVNLYGTALLLEEFGKVISRAVQESLSRPSRATAWDRYLPSKTKLSPRRQRK